MFIEPIHSQRKNGWVEVICGSMFSGKTEELIRRLKRAQIANLKVELYKPAVDNRYSETKAVSHNANSLPAIPILNSQNLLLLVNDADVVGIDEAQFFDEALPDVVNQLTERGIRVIIAGLDMDSFARPFGTIPALLAQAEYITKLHAICIRCGNLANYSHRITTETNKVLLGAGEHYEPLCRHCYFKTNK